MCIFFPVTLTPNDDLLNGCISLLRNLKQKDWNSSSLISVKTSFDTLYQKYPDTNQISGHETFLIDGNTTTGYTIETPYETSKNYTIQIDLKYVKIKLTHYVFQRFLDTACSPIKWTLYGINEKNEKIFLDYRENEFDNSKNDTMNKYEVNSMDSSFSSFFFTIDPLTKCAQKFDDWYLRLKNIEFYGTIHAISNSAILTDFSFNYLHLFNSYLFILMT